MAHTITFDKLAYAKRLERSGVIQEQAEAMAEALGDALKEGSSELATEQNINLLKTELKGEIKNVETRLESLEKRMTQLQWVMGAIFAGVASLVIKAFF